MQWPTEKDVCQRGNQKPLDRQCNGQQIKCQRCNQKPMDRQCNGQQKKISKR